MSVPHEQRSLNERISEYRDAVTTFLDGAEGDVRAIGLACASAVAGGGKVLAAGNGGSAGQAQHFVGEFVGRCWHEHRPYPAQALTRDGTILTAIANDFGYDEVFARQVGAYGQPGDLLVLLTTSGRSPSVVRALEAGRAQGLRTVVLTGATGRDLAARADLAIVVDSEVTPIVQDCHSIALHLATLVAEASLAGEGAG